METHGSCCLQRAMAAGRVVSASAMAAKGTPRGTIATSLGAPVVARKTLDYCRRHPVVPLAVSDAMAGDSCRRFAGELDDAWPAWRGDSLPRAAPVLGVMAPH